MMAPVALERWFHAAAAALRATPGVGLGAIPHAASAALRRALLLAAGLLAAGACLGQPAPAPLPLRNLLVEVRQGDAASLEASAAGVDGGAVAVGSDGRVGGRATVDLSARSRDAARQSVQQLRVLNGGRGALRVGTAQSLQWLQIGWTPRGPAVLGVGSTWVDRGRGIVVQPRWPGGDAPVTVEVQTESSAFAGAGGTASAASLTTLALPLDTWVTVAESSEAVTQRERGVVGSRELAAERRLVVQMRISAP